MDVSLSVIIPAYNEEQRIGLTLDRVLAWAVDHLEAGALEVLVVDDGSSDDTVRVATERGDPVRVLRNGRNRGKGYSVRHGVRESVGERVLFSDADLSTPIEEYAKLAAALGRADIAIGSRGLPESEIARRQPRYRETMGRIFNRIVQTLAVPGVSDTQCGFKLFRGEVARELFADSRIDGFAFDVEVLVLAIRRGYRIQEVPVTWINDERSRVHAVYDSLRMLRDVLRLRFLP